MQQRLRPVPMEETDTASIAQEIIYRNYLPQWRCLRVINVFFSFSPPTLSYSSNGKWARTPRNGWFLPNGDFMVSWCIGSREDLVSSSQFLLFLLSFFIIYVAMWAFCLRGKPFNKDRNYHQYTIGTALIRHLKKNGGSIYLLVSVPMLTLRMHFRHTKNKIV